MSRADAGAQSGTLRALMDHYEKFLSLAFPVRATTVRDVDNRREPHRYRIGRGEEGVLTVQPYKDELLPLWRFATPTRAKASAAALWKRFLEYGREGDFVGMDMARKYLQMGFTRSRRYVNHRGGRKFLNKKPAEPPRTIDAGKAESAELFRTYWQRALRNPRYLSLRRRHEAAAGGERRTIPGTVPPARTVRLR